MARALRLEEPDGVWWDLPVPDQGLAVLAAAAGIVTLAPDCGARARCLERLEAGGDDALQLAAEVLRGAIEGA